MLDMMVAAMIVPIATRAVGARTHPWSVIRAIIRLSADGSSQLSKQLASRRIRDAQGKWQTPRR
jgi:hypothetical protein